MKAWRGVFLDHHMQISAQLVGPAHPPSPERRRGGFLLLFVALSLCTLVLDIATGPSLIGLGWMVNTAEPGQRRQRHARHRHEHALF